MGSVVGGSFQSSMCEASMHILHHMEGKCRLARNGKGHMQATNGLTPQSASVHPQTGAPKLSQQTCSWSRVNTSLHHCIPHKHQLLHRASDGKNKACTVSRQPTAIMTRARCRCVPNASMQSGV